MTQGLRLANEREVARRRVLAEAREKSAKLLDWHSPDSFRAILDDLDSLIADYNRILGVTSSHRDRAFRSWREGWVLKHLFGPLDVLAARLMPEGMDVPDAELRQFGNSVLGVEITEGMSSSHQPWRRDPPGTYWDGDVEQWRKNAAEVPHLLEAAAQRKKHKLYAARSCLLVYLGTGATWGIADDEIQQAITSFQSRYAGTFADVRVLWGETVY